MPVRHRSVVAAVLSVLAPGLGHLYLGLPARALAIWLCSLALTGSVFFGILSLPPGIVVGWLPVLARIGFIAWAAWDAARRARTAAPPDAWYQRWYILALVWLAIAVALQPFVTSGERKMIEAFRIPSGSMEPTVMVGDYLYIDMRGTARVSVTRGSPVVFTSVEERGLKVLKRVVALGGDTVAMRGAQLLPERCSRGRALCQVARDAAWRGTRPACSDAEVAGATAHRTGFGFPASRPE